LTITIAPQQAASKNAAPTQKMNAVEILCLLFCDLSNSSYSLTYPNGHCPAVAAFGHGLRWGRRPHGAWWSSSLIMFV